ncbi:MAG TPA: hypothetical protein DIU00_06890, partial [Phycisphaerales bacterium]|nr:hypothetical protein [Phycisphaerales bacterium]
MSTKPDQELLKQLQIEHLESILPEQLDPELVRKLPLEFLKKQIAIPFLLGNGEVAIALS